MKVFDSESVQRRWNSLGVVQVSDAARRLAAANAPHESLTIGALERELDKENAVDLTDFGSSPSPWQFHENTRKKLVALNKRLKEFWANGGRAA